jgi:hypothetical protein
MVPVQPEPDPFPAPQRRGPGGSIRWAVGSPDGPRSQSWLLKGSRSDDDVYLGPRWDIGVIKLSLHRSGRWRMAWTDEYADSVGLPADTDRVLGRWEPPADIRPGWRHAVTVLVTRESMAQHTTPERRPGKVAFFSPPNEDGGLWFRVLAGRPGGAELTIRGAIEVGGLELPIGGMVAVVVRPGPLTPGSESVVSGLRSHMLAAVTAAGARRNTGFAWSRMDDGAVVLIDPGPVEPEGAGPDRHARGGQPGRGTYVRWVDPAPLGEPATPTGSGPVG